MSFKKLQTSLDNQIKKFQKILEANPEDVSVLMAYAEANLRKGNRLEAMKTYQKLARLRPDQPEVRISLARIYSSMDQHHDAFSELKLVLDTDTKNIEAHLLLRSLVRSYNIPQDLKQDLEEKLAFQASPGRLEIFQRMHNMEKRKYEKLISEYNQQLEDDLGNPIIIFNRRKAEERLSAVEETLRDLEDMINPDLEEEQDHPALTTQAQEPAQEEMPEVIEEEPIPIDEPGQEGPGSEITTQDLNEEEFSDQPLPDQEIKTEEQQSDQEPGEQTITVQEETDAEEMTPGPLDEQPEEEPEPVEDEAAPKPLSPQRKEFYESIKSQTENALKAINQTRGVSTSLITDQMGHILYHIGSDPFEPKELASIILSGMEPLIHFRSKGQDHDKDLLHWVVEFKRGLLIIQPLVKGIYLVVLGNKGANFGAVKYSAEKNSTTLVQALNQAPE